MLNFLILPPCVFSLTITTILSFAFPSLNSFITYVCLLKDILLRFARFELLHKFHPMICFITQINTMLLRFIQLWTLSCSYQLGDLAAISDGLHDFNLNGSILWKPPISTNQGSLFTKKQLVIFISIPIVSSILCILERHSVSYNIPVPQCLSIFLFGSILRRVVHISWYKTCFTKVFS